MNKTSDLSLEKKALMIHASMHRYKLPSTFTWWWRAPLHRDSIYIAAQF